MRPTLLAIACLLTACAGGAEPHESTAAPLGSPTTAGTTRPDLDPVVVPPAAAAPSSDPLLSVHALASGPAEDGAGSVADAPAPIAIDLDAHAFPPRALDPVLTIGDLRFTHYVHPRPGVLRFTLASATLLGPEMRVGYAADGSDAVIVVAANEPVAIGPVAP